MDVTSSVGHLLDGRDGPLVPVALRLAGLLDDPDIAANHAAAVSRELRLVLAEVDVDQVESDGVFDLDARRREREKRRA